MVCDKIWGLVIVPTTLIDWQLNDKDLSAIFGLDILFPVPPFLEPQILQNNPVICTGSTRKISKKIGPKNQKARFSSYIDGRKASLLRRRSTDGVY